MLAALGLQYRKLLLYLLLSVLDLIFTCQLLQNSGGIVYESNPVASAWLHSYGWAGLVLFKVCMVGFISLIALMISIYRPETSARLLRFACIVTAGVVAYSFYLTRMVEASPSELHASEVTALDNESLMLRMWENKSRHRAYVDLMNQLSSDLVARRIGLGEAAEKLSHLVRRSDPVWFRRCRAAYPSLNPSECLAVHLAQYTMSELNPSAPIARRLAGDLESDFRNAFGRSLPGVSPPIVSGNDPN